MSALFALVAVICQANVFSDTVAVTGGEVKGSVQDTTVVFHGIQYATAVRFEHSKLNPLQGTIDATKRGPSCWQPGSKGTHLDKGWETIQIPNSSEECLFLSVYSPLVGNKSDTTKFPVLVYMHAGEFLYGSSNDAESNFPYFSDSVVLVTPNYRLGFFGFSYGPEAGIGDGHMGMQDQRLALRWVQKYISIFNGDPNKVTIMGESSGGTSVGYHLVNKNSWGLFHRAIAESPGLTQVKEEAHAAENTQFVAVSLSLKNPKDCPTRQFFYKRFVDRKLSGFTVHPNSKMGSFQIAKKSCSETTGCIGVFESKETSKHGYWLVKKEDISEKALSVDVNSDYNIHLKWIVMAALKKCLKNAKAVDIAVAMQQYLPFADSFTTDEFAPVVTRVPTPHTELDDTILNLFSKGQVAPKVDVIMGSNLDEATIMMSLLPKFPCNSTFDFFRSWTTEVYGAQKGPNVAKLYEKLMPPLPLCKDERTNEIVQSPWRVAAMRTAGDQAILCPLKMALSKVAEGGGRAFQYYFMKAPTKSLNYDLIGGLKGAFHGAEVPYVFGFPDELETIEDAKLSKAIGCYWNSFIHTGNPSREGYCPPGGENPFWGSYTSTGGDPCAIFGRGTTTIEDGVQSDQCALLTTAPKAAIHIPPHLQDTSQGADTSFIPSRVMLLYTILVFVVFIGGLCAYRHFFRSAPESPKGPDGED